MKKLDPNALPAFYIANSIAIIFIFGLIFFIPGLIGFITGEVLLFSYSTLAFILITCFLLIILFPWAYLWYENFKYKFDSDRVSIEKGIIFKKYVAIPYNRIQNVDIHRGPISRMLNISDLQIQTAGASGVQIIEGRIPGVSKHDAEKLRDEILAKVTSKSQGL